MAGDPAEQDDTDWPGPKAWPAGMALISFFALNVFIQALRVGKKGETEGLKANPANCRWKGTPGK